MAASARNDGPKPNQSKEKPAPVMPMICPTLVMALSRPICRLRPPGNSLPRLQEAGQYIARDITISSCASSSSQKPPAKKNTEPAPAVSTKAASIRLRPPTWSV